MYPLIMAAIWGIGDGVFNTQLSALLAILFKNDTVLLLFNVYEASYVLYIGQG